jgi:hypothetical protein
MPASDYNSLIPQPTDQPSVSQNQLLLNFGAIMDLIDVDHVDFAAIGAGWHNKVTLPVQSPAPTFAVGNLGIYNFLDPITAVNELYFENQLGVATPISASLLSTDPTPNNDVPGWFYLPSGMIVKFGSAVANGSTTITFPVSSGIPVFTQVMWAAAMPRGTGVTDPNTMVSISSFSSTGVTVYGSARTTISPAAASFEYIAIGY